MTTPPSDTSSDSAAVDAARHVRESMPSAGLFAGQAWRISPEPFSLERKAVKELETLGRVLLQFYKSINLLYRQSVEGKQPGWVAALLDQGKPGDLLDLQRDPSFKNDLPRVIRPDLLLTDEGFSLVELDSVPGGIGLTDWMNRVYSDLPGGPARDQETVLGGADGMRQGFAGLFGEAPRVQIVVSEESGSYRPEMEWLARELDPTRFQVRNQKYLNFAPGDAVYRFFELFDLANVPASRPLLELARRKEIQLTPPPKTIFEEKANFGLLWNRNLEEFWQRELGQAFLQRLKRMVPRSWILDPEPLPPHAAFPDINLTHWQQLKTLSKRDRDLILKISGFSEKAWGARGVHLGSDLSVEDWSGAVDEALDSWGSSPYVLQRFHKPRTVPARYLDEENGMLVSMKGRVRLCPYYFVHGQGDEARARLGGVLATICPADKKIIHGMRDAIMAPCRLADA